MSRLGKILLVFFILVIGSNLNLIVPGSFFIIILLAIVSYFLITEYNKLVNNRNAVKNAWSKIDIQLNRRVDLIDNLVETVKGYSIHEKETLTDVTKARSNLLNSDTVKDVEKSNNMLNSSLRTLFAVSEQYPDLKANENFLSLQEQLEITENKIADYRESYNDFVFEYNNSCEKFPSNIVAMLFKFQSAEFFETSTSSKRLPEIKF